MKGDDEGDAKRFVWCKDTCKKDCTKKGHHHRHHTENGHDVCSRSKGLQCTVSCPPACDGKNARHRSVKELYTKSGLGGWIT